MSAVFGFGTFRRNCIRDTLRGHGEFLEVLHYLRLTVSSHDLGKVTINVALLSKELQKIISYCTTVGGMDSLEKCCENSCDLLYDEAIDLTMELFILVCLESDLSKFIRRSLFECKVSFHHIQQLKVFKFQVKSFKKYH